jgi:hypothetical protein
MTRLGGVIAILLALAARAGGLADPMRPPVVVGRAGEAREAAPVLTAVLTFNGERSAIFNGHLVHGGTNVGAYTIEAVLVDGVRYRRGGQVQELRLPRLASPIKKPAAEPAHAASGAK